LISVAMKDCRSARRARVRRTVALSTRFELRLLQSPASGDQKHQRLPVRSVPFRSPPLGDDARGMSGKRVYIPATFRNMISSFRQNPSASLWAPGSGRNRHSARQTRGHEAAEWQRERERERRHLGICRMTMTMMIPGVRIRVLLFLESQVRIRRGPPVMVPELTRDLSLACVETTVVTPERPASSNVKRANCVVARSAEVMGVRRRESFSCSRAQGGGE